MTARATAAIGVRIIALFFFARATISLAGILFIWLRGYSTLGDPRQAALAATWRWTATSTAGLELLAGVLLFFLSRPIARLLARRVE